MTRFVQTSLALLLLLSQGFTALAQEGTVTYEEIVKLNIVLPPEMAHMSENFPQTQSATKHLYFNETAAVFKNAPSDEDELADLHDHDGMMRFRIHRAENESYFNFEENLRTEQREFMGRTFLIDGEVSDLAWRLTDERSEFLGYACQKAVATRDTTSIEAWFTPEISIPAGPGEGGLPGLILVLNVDDGRRSYVAKTLDLEPVVEGTITPPKKGKRISQAEFDKIVEEKMAEMNASSSGGNFVIRMRN